MAARYKVLAFALGVSAILGFTVYPHRKRNGGDGSWDASIFGVFRSGGNRRPDRLNLRVQPSRGHGRRRGNGGGMVLVLILVGCLLFSVVSLLSSDEPVPATPVAATRTPAVTLQLIGAPINLTPADLASTPSAGALDTTTAVATATDAIGIAEAMIEVPTPASAQANIDPDAGFVNVRSGPGLEHPVLGQLTAGQRVPVMGKSSDGQWWQITFEERPGWVYAPLVSFTGDPDAVSVVRAP
ncbi:MAG: SH3 domain-containing protein [Chloroflexi bacterium]|nr:SH3 domain-containing protein [Chloroflexota bacterium]